jgi:hypothetical protein
MDKRDNRDITNVLKEQKLVQAEQILAPMLNVQKIIYRDTDNSAFVHIRKQTVFTLLTSKQSMSTLRF